MPQIARLRPGEVKRILPSETCFQITKNEIAFKASRDPVTFFDYRLQVDDVNVNRKVLAQNRIQNTEVREFRSKDFRSSEVQKFRSLGVQEFESLGVLMTGNGARWKKTGDREMKNKN